MEKDTLKLFNQIRTDKLDIAEPYLFEINLGDKRITNSTPLRVHNRDFEKLENRLSPSFKIFIDSVSNGLHIGIGNTLSIYPIGQTDSSVYWTNLLSWNRDIIDDTLFPSKELFFFGTSGGGEMFGFYTGTRLANGEYPVFWFTPGSVDTKPFVLLNSSFDRFLTMQYYLLKATDNEPTYSYEEAQKFSTGEYLVESERNWQNFHDHLYNIFDPAINKPNHNYYRAALSFEEFIKQIEEIKNKCR